MQCNVVNGCAYKVLGKDLCIKEVDVYSVLAWIISITDINNKKNTQWLSGRTGREIVQIPNPPLYNTLRIRFINCLVWGIYRDLTNQDGKSQSLSCHNVLHL